MKTDFFLVGDSNSAVIGRAATSLGFTFAGGPLAPGRELDGEFFQVQGSDFILTTQAFEKKGDKFKDLLRQDGPILSTVGFNSQLIGQIVARDLRKNKLDSMNLSQAVMEAIVESWKAPAISFYKTVKMHDRKIWFTHSPQRFPPLYFETAIRFEEILQQRLIGMGIPFIDVRASTTGRDGKLLERFHSDLPNDKTHGGISWGHEVFSAFKKAAGLQDGSSCELSNQEQAAAKT